MYRGTHIPFVVLSRASFLLASVFGRVAIDDSLDERQRLSVRYDRRRRPLSLLSHPSHTGRLLPPGLLCRSLRNTNCA